MKNVLQKMLVVLFAVAVTCQVDAANPKRRVLKKRTVAAETPAMTVNTEVSTLDAIAEQAQTLVDAIEKEETKTRNSAKREINRLMKELNPEKKEQIEALVNDLLKDPSKETLRALMAGIYAADTQGDVVIAMEEGRKNIERSGGDPEVIKQAIEKVQVAEAKAEEAGMMSRMISGTKSVLSAPGNYFFGEERTAAKTAFEAIVGSAAIYGIYLAGPKVAEAAKKLYLNIKGEGPDVTLTLPPKEPTNPAEKPFLPDLTQQRQPTPEEDLYMNTTGTNAPLGGRSPLQQPTSAPSEREIKIKAEIQRLQNEVQILQNVKKTEKAINEEELQQISNLYKRSQERSKFKGGFEKDISINISELKNDINRLKMQLK